MCLLGNTSVGEEKVLYKKLAVDRVFEILSYRSSLGVRSEMRKPLVWGQLQRWLVLTPLPVSPEL